MSSAKTRFKRILESIGFMISHPYKSMVGIYNLRDEYISSQGSLMEVLPVIELMEVLGDTIPHVGVCSYLGMGSTAPDYALLKGLAEKCAVKHGEDYLIDYLEIGTWRGESIVNIMDSEKVKSAVSITLDGSEFSDVVKRNVNYFITDQYNSKFSQHFADSMHFDFNSLGKKFDLIFIDGDHSYEAIFSDSRNALRLLKDEHSVIVWHDYGDTPEKVNGITLKALRDAIPKDEQKNLYWVRNTLCAVYTKDVYSVIDNTDVPSYIYEVEMRGHKL